VTAACAEKVRRGRASCDDRVQISIARWVRAC
jgi:hypothetical protein